MSKDRERPGLDEEKENQKSRKMTVAEETRVNDPDPSYFPALSDEVALLILARVPRSEYRNLGLLNRRYRSLVRSGELYSVRKSIGVREPSVLTLASGEHRWWSYDPGSGSRRSLPVLPCDPCFSLLDKESVCAGTHLLVSGKEVDGRVVWRYELSPDRWFKGPNMITPRCLFASAGCAHIAFVAGGVGPARDVLNAAEMYDPGRRAWVELPRMRRRRKRCSGCFMDNRFYVIGGQDERGESLTCGEFYDPEKRSWKLIPGMIGGAPGWPSPSPPLVAVADNELYSLEASTNRLRVYVKRSNSWKDLGMAPVRADHSRGWGVAFRSLGDELLIIGSRGDDSYACFGATVCTCRPHPGSTSLDWKVLAGDGDQWSSSIYNCSVMLS